MVSIDKNDKEGYISMVFEGSFYQLIITRRLN